MGGGSAIAGRTLTSKVRPADDGKVHTVTSTGIPAPSASPATDERTADSGQRRPASSRVRQGLDASGALLPAILVVFFSFQAGGFFADSTGVAAVGLAVLLALRATLGRRPFASFTVPVVVVAAALGFYATWILLSASWSNAPGRALLEFNRTLLYGFAFLACATFSWTPARLAWAVRALVLAIFVVCLVGWASRVAPDVVSLDAGSVRDRLAQPLTYWNTQGLIAALGIVFALHLASSPREPLLARALGAGAVPLLASTMYFTLSRGALLAVAVGICAYVVLYRSRGLLTTALAVVPATVVALLYSYDADRLVSDESLSAAAVIQGHTVARAVALCTVAAFLIALAAGRWLHGPLHRAALPPHARRPVRIAAAVALLAAVVVVPLALGAPDYASRQWDRFMTGNTLPGGDQRVRLLNPGNNGRLDHWRIALDEWEAHPLAGTGAGTFEHSWNKNRESEFNVRDGHSLYLENLSELGLVGLGLLVLALGTLGGTVLWHGQVRRRRREWTRDPSLYAVFCAAMLTWAVHAGLDWIWETPAVTVWVFALGGMMLAARVSPDAPSGPGRTARVAIGLGCLVLAAVPVQVVRSQTALDEAVTAFRAAPQDCPKAIDASLRSLDSIGSRAEPWEIIGYCDVGQRELNLAVEATRNAVRRDPASWTYRYAQALVQAAAGKDPRPAAREALRRNPRSQLARQAVRVFERSRPRSWPRLARRLQLPTS